MNLEQDIKSYEHLQNPLIFLKLIIQSEKEIKTENVVEQSKMFDKLEQKLFKCYN